MLIPVKKWPLGFSKDQHFILRLLYAPLQGWPEPVEADASQLYETFLVGTINQK